MPDVSAGSWQNILKKKKNTVCVCVHSTSSLADTLQTAVWAVFSTQHIPQVQYLFLIYHRVIANTSVGKSFLEKKLAESIMGFPEYLCPDSGLWRKRLATQKCEPSITEML